MNRKSVVLVVIQFFCLFALVMTGPFFSTNRLMLLLQLFSLGLIIWAYVSMTPVTFSIFPQVRKNGTLVKSGPYSMIRHPMYSAIILLCILWIIDSFTWFRLIIGILLLLDLLVKVAYEENILLKNYPGYSTYCKKTDRLCPFIY